jgi:ABC-type transport system involved in multi-copper enzyme maturation permease subunit
MAPQGHASRHGMLRCAHAEFLKIWASRIPLVFILGVPVLCYLVVFEFYHVEQAGTRVPLHHALQAVPLLFATVWKMLLFQAAVLAFAAFWTTVDSQYGMIRVVGAQPLSRLEYLLGKWIGVSGHVVLVTLALILSLLGWAVLYSGLAGISASDVMMFVRFSLELLTLTLALGGIGLTSASFRRTVGSGIVTAMLAFIALAVMTTLPFDVFPPRFVFVRYLFFPVQEFPNPFPTEDSLFLRMYSRGDFYLVVLATPLILAIPAILYFRRRDITE